MTGIRFLVAKSAAGAPQHRLWLSGRYYGSEPGSTTTSSFTLNTAKATPLWVPHPVTIDRIGLEVTTGVATAVARMGIYASTSSDQPGSLVADYGTVDASTTGVKEITVSQSLAAGLYWLAAVPQVAVATFRSISGSLPPVSGNTFLGTTATLAMNCYYLNNVTGALPATWTGSLVDAAPARVRVRVTV